MGDLSSVGAGDMDFANFLEAVVQGVCKEKGVCFIDHKRPQSWL